MKWVVKKEEAESYMDKEKSSEQASKENDPAVATTAADEISQPDKNKQSGDEPGKDTEYFFWGMTRYEFVSVLIQVSICFATVMYMAMTILQVSLTKQTIRARLQVRKVERASDIAPGKPVAFNVRYRNYGGSQAVQVTRTGDIGTCDELREETCPQIQSLSPMKVGWLGVEAGNFFTLRLSPQSPEVIEALRRGEKTIYFYGTIEYLDIFARHHFTEYCYFYAFTDTFSYCPFHNDGD